MLYSQVIRSSSVYAVIGCYCGARSSTIQVVHIHHFHDYSSGNNNTSLYASLAVSLQFLLKMLCLPFHKMACIHFRIIFDRHIGADMIKTYCHSSQYLWQIRDKLAYPSIIHHTGIPQCIPQWIAGSLTLLMTSLYRT